MKSKPVMMALSMLPVAMACGGSSPPPARTAAVGGGQSAAEYQRCKAMEQEGDATACWRLFKKRFGPLAQPSERDYADMYIAAHEGTQAHDKRTATDSAGQQAPTEEGIVATPTEVTASAPTAPELPTPTVGFGDCYAGFTPGDDPVTSLQALTEKCGAPTGMIAVGDPVHATQGAADQPDVFPAHLAGDYCFRIFVVGDSGIQSIVAKLTDDAGTEVAADPSGDRFPVVPTHRAFCPPEGGADYKLVVSVLRGGGTYYVQLWKGARTASATPEQVTSNP